MAQNKNMKQVNVPLEQKVEEAVQENAAQVKKPSILSNIAQAGLEVAKQALPMAVSAIPGVGPVLGTLTKGLLSTMNDDEWFGEYKSAGATFNELLGSSTVGGAISGYGNNATALHNLVGAMAFHYCFLNFGPAIKDNVFPAMLAFVRKKTDNVLVDDTDKYWYSIADTAQLYAIYYSIRKYLKLAGQLPLNAPTLNEVAIACAPSTISQLTGIADTLRDFLKTSTGIPYALAEYLRWRFGTVFLSENSEKAGFIVYDPAYVMTHAEGPNPTAIEWMGGEKPNRPSIDRANIFIATVTDVITKLKNDILAQGRANADIALAFKDHQIRYDVEERHYDEKEFNLRCNLDSQNGSIVSTPKGTVRLILDSKLNMNAAIQAVTMSTIPNDQDPGEVFDVVRDVFQVNDGAFIHISDIIICSEMSRMGNGELVNALSQTMFVNTTWFYLTKYSSNVNLHGNDQKDPIITANLSYDREASDAITFENLGLATRVPTDLNQYLRSLAYKILSISLQMHYNESVFAIGIGNHNGTQAGNVNYFQVAPLSYDTAMITNTQLLAIQRQCVRNLFRGEYTRKGSVVPKVAEAVADVVEVSGGDTTVLANKAA